MRLNIEKRRGNIVALVALSLTAILGVVAIALDGGLLLDNHRSVQAAADAAALAAADDLFAHYGQNSGLDPNNTASGSATSTASANGYSNDGVTSVVTVNIPPSTGSFKGKAGYAEVIIQYNQKRGFSSIFGSGDLPVTARAVASGKPGTLGILILDPHLQGALEIRGTVNLLNGGQLYSNSDNTTPNDAASAGATGSVYVGSGITVTAGGINVLKSLVADGTVTYTNNGGLKYYTTPVPDPLANIPEPTTTGLTNQGSVTVTSNTTLNPGVYNNITIGTSGGGSVPTVTLSAGIYYIANGGSFTLNSGTLQGTGVMIVNNTQQDTVFGWTNPATGTINLSPPVINADGTNSGGTWPTGTSAATYAGISMWVPRSWTQEVHFQSDHNATISGTWYAQGAEYDIRANGSSVVFNIGNYICDLGEWNQKTGGNANTGTGTININPGTAAAILRPTLVE
jgi:hypothetical protein